MAPPSFVNEADLPEVWTCDMHPNAPEVSCETAEDGMEEEEVLEAVEQVQEDSGGGEAPLRPRLLAMMRRWWQRRRATS